VSLPIARPGIQVRLDTFAACRRQQQASALDRHAAAKLTN
jgi:hypothetical protein